jgi:hypothetical protein
MALSSAERSAKWRRRHAAERAIVRLQREIGRAIAAGLGPDAIDGAIRAGTREQLV